MPGVDRPHEARAASRSSPWRPLPEPDRQQVDSGPARQTGVIAVTYDHARVGNGPALSTGAPSKAFGS